MYRHILIPTDGSALAEKAEIAGIELAKSLGARVTGFAAVAKFQPPGDKELVSQAMSLLLEHNERAKETAQTMLARITERARAAGIDLNTESTQCERPYEAIIETALRLRCDLICMCSHGRHGLLELVYGSQTKGVLTHTKIPTLVYR